VFHAALTSTSFDLGRLPILDVERTLLATVKRFSPTLFWCFPARHIQILRLCMGAAATRCRLLEVFYAANPLRPPTCAGLGGLAADGGFPMAEPGATSLVRRGPSPGPPFHPEATGVASGRT